MESELKEMLRERAEDAQIEPTIPAGVSRRARSRRRRNIVLSALVTVAVVAASVVSIRAIVDVDPLPDRPAVGGWPGIWPQETRAEAEDAQEAVEASDERFDCTEGSREACLEHHVVWQLDGAEVARRFALESLGWPAASAATYVGPDSAGPVTLLVNSCDQDVACRPVFRATVTLERLLRPDRFGLWFVTSFDQELLPQAADDLVGRFLEARLESLPVDSLISLETEDIYEVGEAGLSLYGGEAGPFVGYEVVGRDPAGEDTSLFLVRLARDEGVVAESILVGPGFDTNGDPRPVLVLSVSRVEFQEIDETVPPPDAGPTAEEEQVVDFVTAFMEARLKGSGAEVYLSSWAQMAYESHERLWHPEERGLYLYGAPDGDPTVTYVDFRIGEVRGWDGTCDWVPPSACQDAWVVLVVTDLAPVDGSAGEAMQETLWVAPADGAASEFADWMISAAARGDEPEGH